MKKPRVLICIAVQIDQNSIHQKKIFIQSYDNLNKPFAVIFKLILTSVSFIWPEIGYGFVN